jgi:hypothetical protein
LISALDGGEWLASRPGRFTPWKEPLVPIGQEEGTRLYRIKNEEPQKKLNTYSVNGIMEV